MLPPINTKYMFHNTIPDNAVVHTHVHGAAVENTEAAAGAEGAEDSLHY